MLRRVLLALSLSIITAGPALAAHPLITDDTGTQGRGKFQLELNSEISHDKETKDGVEVRERAAKVAAVLSAGITEDIDIVIGFPWQWSRVKQDGIVTADNNGPGDTSLEAEMALFQAGRLFSCRQAGYDIPSGNENRGLGNGKVSLRRNPHSNPGVGALLCSRQCSLHAQ